MDFGSISGNGYLLIGGLILIGGGLLLISLFVNRRVAISVRAEERHREKLYEYYRNTFSQLGVILIGIGVSLFIFFFQQSYQEQQRHAAEVRQLLAKLSVRVGRAATVANSLVGFDRLIRDTEDSTSYVVKSGAELAQQVRSIFNVERDVDLEAIKVATISDDLATSTLAGDINPVLWFAITEDESEIAYGTAQLEADYGDLHAALDGLPPETAVADPERGKRIGDEVHDILRDMDILRDRSRRLIGRGCWFLSTGSRFLDLTPIAALEADYMTHIEWIDQAKVYLAPHRAGGRTCFEVLKYSPEGPPL
jgi:hypothetical protein